MGTSVLLYQASNDQVSGKNPLVLLGNTIWNQQMHRELAPADAAGKAGHRSRP